jgi:hypothetical protein
MEKKLDYFQTIENKCIKEMIIVEVPKYKVVRSSEG